MGRGTTGLTGGRIGRGTTGLGGGRMGRWAGLDLVLLIPGREPKVGLFDEGLGEVTGREGSEDAGLTARVGLITLMTVSSKDPKDRLEFSDLDGM